MYVFFCDKDGQTESNRERKNVRRRGLRPTAKICAQMATDFCTLFVYGRLSDAFRARLECLRSHETARRVIEALHVTWTTENGVGWNSRLVVRMKEDSYLPTFGEGALGAPGIRHTVVEPAKGLRYPRPLLFRDEYVIQGGPRRCRPGS